MLELWIPITVAAAFFQNLRSGIQKHLHGKLSVAGAAYSRFVYALPVAAVYVHSLHLAGYALPTPNAKFFLYCLLGGISQIMFTAFLIWLFSFRSFAVGTTFSKLEVVMVALLGALLLGDALSAAAVLAIALSAFGVLALGAGQAKLTWRELPAAFVHKSTFIGLASAAWLGASSVFYRGASLSLLEAGAAGVAMSAAFSLLVSLALQTLLMGGYLAVRERGELTRVWRNWRWAGAAGVTGAIASIGWFTAFTLHTAAHVRALGQVELVFTMLAGWLVFKEKITRLEGVGIGLVSGGILLLVAAG